VLVVLTDLGSITTHMIDRVAGCDAIVLECNHDLRMLAVSRYPPSLKARIGGRLGHLSNATAAEILTRCASARLQHVVAAHLSRENNSPALARAALAACWGGGAEAIVIADPFRDSRGCGSVETVRRASLRSHAKGRPRRPFGGRKTLLTSKRRWRRPSRPWQPTKPHPRPTRQPTSTRSRHRRRRRRRDNDCRRRRRGRGRGGRGRLFLLAAGSEGNGGGESGPSTMLFS
jgi:hypothetical protein